MTRSWWGWGDVEEALTAEETAALVARTAAFLPAHDFTDHTPPAAGRAAGAAVPSSPAHRAGPAVLDRPGRPAVARARQGVPRRRAEPGRTGRSSAGRRRATGVRAGRARPPGLVLHRRHAGNPVRRRQFRRRRDRTAVPGTRGVTGSRPPRPGRGDRPDEPRRAHPGRGVRTGAGGPAPPARADPAALPPVVHALHARRLAGDPRRMATSPRWPRTSTTSPNPCAS